MVMRIKDLREAQGMTQVQLAAEMGSSQSTVAEWEREVYLPKSRHLPRLAEVLQCSIDDLFEKEDNFESYAAI